MKYFFIKTTLYILGLLIFTQQVYSENTTPIILADSNISIEKRLNAIDIYIESNLNNREKLIDYINKNSKNSTVKKFIKFYDKKITEEDLKKIVWMYVSLKYIKSQNIYRLKTLEKSLIDISSFWIKQTETSTKKLLLRKLIKKINIPDNDKVKILNAMDSGNKDKLDDFYKSVTWFIQKLEFKDFLIKIENYKKYLIFEETKDLNFLNKSKADINQVLKFNYCRQYDMSTYEFTFDDNLHDIFKMKQCNIEIIYEGEYCTDNYLIATSKKKCKKNLEYIRKMGKLFREYLAKNAKQLKVHIGKDLIDSEVFKELINSKDFNIMSIFWDSMEEIRSFEKRNLSMSSEAVFMIENHFNWKDYKLLLPTSGKSGFYIDCSGKVVYVIQGSPADRYGIKKDDVITSLNSCSNSPSDIYKKSFENTNNFIGLPDKIYKIELLRDGKVIRLKLRSD